MEIDIEEKEFTADIERVMNALRALDGTVEIRDRVERLWIDALGKGTFNESEYLDIVDDTLGLVIDKIDDRLVAKLCLDLSRLHCGVRDLYEAKGIVPKLLEIAAKEPLDYTEYNRVLIEDYTYSYYYWKAKHILNSDGVEALTKFIKEHQYLNSEKGGRIVESILLSLVDLDIGKDKDKLSYLRNNFGDFKALINKLDRLTR